MALPGAAAALGALTEDQRAIVTSGGRVLARLRKLLRAAGMRWPDLLDAQHQADVATAAAVAVYWFT